MKFERTFTTGLITGIILVLILGLVTKWARTPSPVVVQWRGEKLTKEELRQSVIRDLIPVENDKAAILRRGAEDWMKQRLFAKEAKKKKLSMEEFYNQEIWSRVNISSEDVLGYYQRNASLFRQPFDQIKEALYKNLRKHKLQQVEAAYLQELIEKNKIKIYWEKIGGIPPSVPSQPPAAEAPQVQDAAPAAAAPLPAMVPAQAAVPANAPFRGNANAPITINEFVDFNCHFCRVSHATMGQILANYPDKVRLVFRHYPLSMTEGEGSFLVHEASLCAREQNKFWEFHDAVFAQEGQAGKDNLDQLASQAGLNKEALQQCLQSGKYREEIKRDRQEGANRGVQGTPNFFINDVHVVGAFPYEHFRDVIEGILDPSKAKPVAQAPQPQPQGPVEFKDLDGRPAMGNKNAPVTVVEFSDFFCPFCKKGAGTMHEIMKNYEGKVRLVFRHFPLAMHQGAERAHQAAECAHEQGKFWGYHDALFDTLGQPKDDEKYIQLAKEAGLNEKKFGKCLNSNKYQDLVKKEIETGNNAGVQGTPSFFINGQPVSGALPYDNFKQLIDQELGKAKS